MGSARVERDTYSVFRVPCRGGVRRMEFRHELGRIILSRRGSVAESLRNERQRSLSWRSHVRL